MSTIVRSAVTSVPAAGSVEALLHFSSRLAFETDVSDVGADLAAGAADVVVVDVRSAESWAQGHVQGAIHLPTAEIATRAADLIDRDVTVVVYCWGPGCNGATRAAREFARLGRPVKEMLGGFEYWVREGFPIVVRPADPSTIAEPGKGAGLAGTAVTGEAGTVIRRPIDPLTAPVSAIGCAC
jgi:rhodanese-related sulfurtransferase